MKKIEEIVTLKKLIVRLEKENEDRRWQFEEWNKGTIALIDQYRKEIAKLEEGIFDREKAPLV